MADPVTAPRDPAARPRAAALRLREEDPPLTLRAETELRALAFLLPDLARLPPLAALRDLPADLARDLAVELAFAAFLLAPPAVTRLTAFATLAARANSGRRRRLAAIPPPSHKKLRRLA